MIARESMPVLRCNWHCSPSGSLLRSLAILGISIFMVGVCTESWASPGASNPGRSALEDIQTIPLEDIQRIHGLIESNRSVTGGVLFDSSASLRVKIGAGHAGTASANALLGSLRKIRPSVVVEYVDHSLEELMAATADRNLNFDTRTISNALGTSADIEANGIVLLVDTISAPNQKPVRGVRVVASYSPKGEAAVPLPALPWCSGCGRLRFR